MTEDDCIARLEPDTERELEATEWLNERDTGAAAWMGSRRRAPRGATADTRPTADERQALSITLRRRRASRPRVPERCNLPDVDEVRGP